MHAYDEAISCCMYANQTGSGQRQQHRIANPYLLSNSLWHKCPSNKDPQCLIFMLQDPVYVLRLIELYCAAWDVNL